MSKHNNSGSWRTSYWSYFTQILSKVRSIVWSWHIFSNVLLALQSGTYHSSQRVARPGIAFRGHVYQPTEMALVMNGGTVSIATTRHDIIQLHWVLLLTASFFSCFRCQQPQLSTPDDGCGDRRIARHVNAVLPLHHLNRGTFRTLSYDIMLFMVHYFDQQ